ncbi:DDT domain-containing protein [Nymphaea thermarum]|nr:DDT domain-containing protein [Nymphaea thermarum]
MLEVRPSMEFVGKAVRKKFRGFGVFAGVIESYDPSTGFFRVVYEDGDSEELELSEIASVLQEEGRSRGRPPKKRRRVAGKAASWAVDGKQMEEVGSCEDSPGTQMAENGLQAGRSPEMGCSGGLEVEEVKEVGFVEGFGSTPLTQGTLGESDGINGGSKADHSFRVSELAGHETAVVASSIEIRTADSVFFCDANEDGQSRGLEDNGIKGLPDLNGNGILGASEETSGVNCDHAFDAEQKGVSGCVEENQVDARDPLDGDARKESCSFICREVRKKVEDCALDSKEIVCPTVVAENGFIGAFEGTQNGDGGVSLSVHGAASSRALEEMQIKEEDHRVCENGNGDSGIALGLGRAASSRALEEQMKKEDHQARENGGVTNSESDPLIASEVVQNGENVASDLGERNGSLPVESVEAQFQTPPRRRGPKRKLSENGTSFPPVTLRRSARRAAIILNSSSAFPSDPEPMVASSASAVMNNDHVNLVDKDPPQDHGCIEPTLPLPLSSEDLGIDELPALDIFSVYSCLRSFSTFLFLSPFTIEAFVAALKSTFVNPLIDCIHFSLLYALKRHLKSLSGDDSKIASACLRSLDWELLDLLTWPVYLVEYLLISGSAVSSGLQLARLNLLNGEYYKQPAAVKLEVLRCLCDDFMETEEIRGEIDRRALVSALYGETDRTVNFFGSTSSTLTNDRGYKKRKVNADLTKHVITLEKDGLEGSPLCQDPFEASIEDIKNDDWNSDDCCLCKMDGNLICCDGCPAAYHSRCVGVSRDLLPEGDWYCPECVMDKTVGRFKSCSPLQGGELLGIDPLGRIYFATYGYLLVLTSDEGGSCCYYSKKDLNLVIEMLKSSSFVCDEIVNAILSHCEVPLDSDSAKNVSLQYLKSVGGINACYPNNSTRLVLVPSSSYTQEVPKDGDGIVRKDEHGSSACTIGGSHTLSGLQSENVVDSLALSQHTESPIATLDASTAALQVTSSAQDCQQAIQWVEDSQTVAGSVINKSVCSSCEHDMSNTISVRLDSMQVEKPILDSVPDKQINTMISSSKLADIGKDGALKCPSEPSLYINSYSLGQIASSIAKEVSHAFPSGIQESMNKSTSDTMLPLLKVFSSASRMFTWPNVEKKALGMVQEKCGWCFTCRNPSDKDCLLRMTDKNFEVVSEKKTVGLRSKKNRKSHLTSIVLYILSIEERLNGLLSGPWQNPQYRKHWRKNLLKASTITAVKRQLLILEANIRPVALAVDWLKYIDSSASLGSALFVSTKLDNIPTVSGGSRKRSRKKNLYSETISGPDIAAVRSGVHWWRGGSISRQLFRWKMLPRVLTLRSGRQAGCKRIPGILYPEALDFAKRPKNLAWRASVELSLTATDLGLQVRDLDAHIKWNNIIGSEISLHESAKRLRPWKKVTIRRKSIEGENVKYLLDFGKRKVIPDIVTRNGIKLEDASGEKEKYWLHESFVPLNLLRVYEEKRIARADKKMNLGPITKEGRRRFSRRDWLSHLISKRESCGRCICGHCKQDLVVRHAVKCESCEGFFHKRHVFITTSTRNKSCTITCYNCQDKKRMTTRASKAQKAKSQNIENTKCRSSSKSNKKSKKKSVQKKKVKKNERKKASKISKKGQAKKVPLKGTARSFQRPRTRVHYVFWLNGLLWTKKLNDERVQKFIETNVLLPQVTDNASQAPACFICHRIYDSRLLYVSCEICREWFHGDALGITTESVSSLLGFKCYKCCKRDSPECPYSKEATQEDTSVQSTSTDVKAGEFCSDDDMLLGAFSKKPRLLQTEEIQGLFCDMTTTHDQVPEVTNVGPSDALSLDAGVQAEGSMASLG